MNKNQRITLITIAVGIVAAFLFPPYAFFVDGNRAIKTGHAFIANIPSRASVHIIFLLIEWLGILLLGGIAYFLFKDEANSANLIRKERVINVHQESIIQDAKPSVYAWRRFFARQFDYFISTIILCLLCAISILLFKGVPDWVAALLFDTDISGNVDSLLWGFISVFLWVWFEPLFMKIFGNTPGKALFKLTLSCEAVDPGYFLRSFTVCGVGLGAGVPLISPITMLIAVIRLKVNRVTDWDRWGKFKVEAEKLTITRVFFSIILFIFLFLFVSMGIYSIKNYYSISLNLSAQKIDNDRQPNYESSENNYQSNQTPLTNNVYQGDETDFQIQRAIDFYNKENYYAALQIYTKLAAQGLATAQKNLGWMYSNGQGVTKDYENAVYWYRKAAEQGEPIAQSNLGYCYENGIGVAKDYTQARFWYEKSATQGYMWGQNNLGIMYDQGLGIDVDHNKAAYWYQKASEQGFSEAQYNLGWLYANGVGVNQDYEKAFDLYKKSADQGYSMAQNNLALLYENGQGVKKDQNQAVILYKKSAEQGYSVAQNNLAILYENGIGVDKDLHLAAYWYQKAADQGDENAIKNLTNLKNK
jgi:TPR repeat protein